MRLKTIAGVDSLQYSHDQHQYCTRVNLWGFLTVIVYNLILEAVCK